MLEKAHLATTISTGTSPTTNLRWWEGAREHKSGLRNADNSSALVFFANACGKVEICPCAGLTSNSSALRLLTVGKSQSKAPLAWNAKPLPQSQCRGREGWHFSDMCASVCHCIVTGVGTNARDGDWWCRPVGTKRGACAPSPQPPEVEAMPRRPHTQTWPPSRAEQLTTAPNETPVLPGRRHPLLSKR